MTKILFIFLILFGFNNSQAIDEDTVLQLTKEYRQTLEGTYLGEGCQLNIKTAGYGEGYYKVLEFIQEGKKTLKQTFHVASFAEVALERDNESTWIDVRDEVGSGFTDNHIRLKMEMSAEGEIIWVKFTSTKVSLIWPHFQHNIFKCANMIMQ